VITFDAHTWAEFLTAIREVRRELNAPQVLWYRGHAKSAYQLVPYLFRKSPWPEKERILFEEYERSAAHLLDAKDNSWEMLQDMQHYGIPTRLLDWTDVLGIAVAFALSDSDDSNDSVIYILDPLALNGMSGLSTVKRASSDPAFDYKSVYWEGKPFSPNYPIAIDGKLHNDRLRAQRGNFTVHGRNDAPLDDQVPNVIGKVALCSSAKPEAREFLEHANLNAFTIYPDIVGMAQHIVRKHLPV
jgi:hypothetical protein